MAAPGPMFESLQRLQSLMTSFHDSLSQLCKDNSSESALDLRENLMEYYHDRYKALQSCYETLNIKEEKPEESATLVKNIENKISNVQVNDQLKKICDDDDGSGLIKYIVLNLKDEKTLREDLQVALSNAPNAAKLALKSLQDYNFSNFGITRACILILESLDPIFGNNDSAAVPLHLKNPAREIANVWRNQMNKKCALDCQAFLHLLKSFRIVADYEKDELLEILIPVSSHKQAPELCRSLGLSPDADFLDKISKNRGQLDVLRFAHAFGMMEKVDPVGLLTSLVTDVDKNITETRALMAVTSQLRWTNAENKKMAILSSVIDHVEMYGLQCDSFKDNLLEELRKMEVERKRRKGARRSERTKRAAKAKRQEYKEKAAEKEAREKEDREKAGEKAQEKEDGKKAAEQKAQEKEDGKKAAEQKAQEKEDRKEDSVKNAQYKRRQSFEIGYGLSERENYASKRAKHASPNETTRIAGGRDNSEASLYNIYRVKNKSGIIGHDHNPSDFIAASRSATGLAVGAFTSAPSMAAQRNDARRRDEGNHSALGTSNLTPMGPSLYSSGVPAGAFSVPLSNVAEVNYRGRGEQSYMSNLGEVDKNHVRASLYGTGDLAKSSTTESNYNFEGRGHQSYKFNFGEIDNNPVRASAYVTGVVPTSSATQRHYERRGPELYTSTLGGGLTGSIGSSVYGSNSRTIPSDVNQGSYESGLGQYSGFAGRNMVPVVSSVFGSSVSSLPSSSVTEGRSERRGSVIDRYQFKIG